MIFFSAAARFSLVEFFRIGRDIRFPVVRGFDADDLNRGFSFSRDKNEVGIKFVFLSCFDISFCLTLKYLSCFVVDGARLLLELY